MVKFLSFPFKLFLVEKHVKSVVDFFLLQDVAMDV